VIRPLTVSLSRHFVHLSCKICSMYPGCFPAQLRNYMMSVKYFVWVGNKVARHMKLIFRHSSGPTAKLMKYVKD
jgi:hypothetical protein